MKHDVMSPLLNDTIKYHRHMKVLACRGEEDFGITYWHDISTVFRWDPMKVKWFYQRDFKTTPHPVRFGDKLFAIEREWFKKYFKNTFVVTFNGEQQRAFISLSRQNENAVENYFKKTFRDAGISEYLFLLGTSDSVMSGLGFLNETDAVIAQSIVDQMRWDGEDGEYQLS